MARVLVPLADGCEELEAVTIIDILRRAGIEVVAAGLNPGPVKGSRGVTLVPDNVLEYVLYQFFDLVALPGGKGGMEALRADPRIIALLQRQASEGRHVAAICAAPAVLAQAGLLADRRATSYPGFLDGVEGVDLREDPVVQDDRIITSRGPGTAMDFALALVEELAGKDRRREVERALQRPPRHMNFD
ncbi:MAG TPA: DJ-1 family glyoxalase III [Burkholderiales bacterium]|nr:DJ-1 family glyoxalase III [Burkholderiales bacterium]